jgi:hypothetical protein
VRWRDSLRQKDYRRTQANKSQPTAQKPWHRLFSSLFKIFLQIKDRELTSLMNNLTTAEQQGKLKIFMDGISSFALQIARKRPVSG